MRDAGRPRQRVRLACIVVGAVEDHADGGNVRLGSELTYELVPVDDGHQDVANDQIGAPFAHQRQCLPTIAGFEDSMALAAKQRDEEISRLGGRSSTTRIVAIRR